MSPAGSLASLLFLLCLLSAAFLPSEAVISSTDRAALDAIFGAFRRPSSPLTFVNYCGENGVSCGTVEPQRVTGISLSGAELTGSISLQLGVLTELVTLNLSSNALSGSLPNIFTNLRKLTTVNLRDNRLNGVLPLSLMLSTGLRSLDLSLNAFSGALPGSLGIMTGLTELRLGTNQFSSTIPAQLSSLTSLLTLDLSENSLVGSLPANLLSSASLRFADLHLNSLSGPFPTTLSANLTYLDLSQNSLSGTIPTQIGNLASLRTFLFWSNLLSGTIPTQVGNLRALTYLDGSKNGLVGNIPTQIGSLSSLATVYLEQNSIDGTLPTLSSSVKTLHLFRNNIIGSLPSSYSTIADLDLSFNKLSGSIPTQFFQSSFSFLYLNSNSFCPFRDFSSIALSSDFSPIPCSTCPQEVRLEVTWPETGAGQTSIGTCPAGFAGTPRRDCFSNATWASTANSNSCTRLRCPALYSGFALFNASNSLTNVTGTCDANFAGPVFRFCQADGTWAAPVGACVATDQCPQVVFQFTVFPATPYGATATGTCADGARLSSSGLRPTRLCDRKTQTWSSKVAYACVRA